MRITLLTLITPFILTLHGFSQDNDSQNDFALIWQQYFSALRAFEVEYEAVYIDHDTNTTMKEVGRYIYSSPKLSFEMEQTVGDFPTRKIMYTYDGETYWFLGPESFLSFTKNRAKIPFKPDPGNPIVAMFAFAFQDSDSQLSMDELKNPRVWKKMLENSEVQHHQQTGLHKVQFKSMAPNSAQEVHVEVHIDETKGFYPVYWKITQSTGSVSECKLLEFRPNTHGGIRTIVPTHIINTEKNSKGTIISTKEFRTIKTSLDINSELTDEVFVIPSALANNIYDIDLELMLKGPELR